MNLINSEVIDIILVLSFTYFILSFVSSSILELMYSIFNSRGKLLKEFISKLLNGKAEDTAVERFYNHPLIKSLKDSFFKIKINFIPSKYFAKVLLDISNINRANISESAKSLAENEILSADAKNLIEYYVKEGNDFLSADDFKNLENLFPNELIDKYAIAQNGLEKYYENAMKGLEESFKKGSTKWILIIASSMILFFNVDTIKITETLYSNKKELTEVTNKVVKYLDNNKIGNYDSVSNVDSVSTLVKKDSTSITQDTVKKDSINKDTTKNGVDDLGNSIKQLDSLHTIITDLGSLGIPLGWDEKWKEQDFFSFLIRKIAGLLLTIFAVTMGAPFWYDIMKRLIGVRKSLSEEKKG
ncbi:MAG: hypothetical protein KDC73_02450 [Ignavibacteriae bacterium]|nr:hypothetical protein [Ignavibacteriota bacterium]MCB9244419.1 hypothetical protein [Ignavibacteriales bacterium]